MSSPLQRALQTLDTAAVQRLLAQRSIFEGRIGANRDFEREARADALYEDLRLLSKRELKAVLTAVRGDRKWPDDRLSRQELIAMIIQHEVYEGQDRASAKEAHLPSALDPP